MPEAVIVETARTPIGRALKGSLKDVRPDDMEAAGVIETRPIEDDPGAVTLLNKLSRVSRKRWPEDSPVEAPRLMPPPKPKPAEEPAPA